MNDMFKHRLGVVVFIAAALFLWALPAKAFSPIANPSMSAADRAVIEMLMVHYYKKNRV